ncbi:MAG: hypothetical protein ACRYGH_12030 [Janthinobacterium lividum]
MDSAASVGSPAVPKSYWTATGNIVRERPYGPGGVETRYGTKHFTPGAKVYIIDWYAGMCERLIVVGVHRKSKRLIKLVLDVKAVENLRPRVCYVPAVIAKIEQHYSPMRLGYLTQEFAERICHVVPMWQAQNKERPQAYLRESTVKAASSFLTRLWLDLQFLLKN